MGSLLFKSLVGALAGLVAWLVWEPSAPPYGDFEGWTVWQLRFIVTMCLLIGGAVGTVNGWSKGSRTHALREGVLGALFGLIGGGMGLAMSSALVRGFGHSPDSGTLSPVDMTARVLAVAPIIFFIGLGVGAGSLSLRGLFQGAVGGLVAGVVTGTLFNPICDALASVMLAAHPQTTGVIEIGAPGRAFLSVFAGLTIALFIGLAERVLRSAWVRLSLGRNEGKEWAIDRPQMMIGRSETAQIPIFSDPNIAPAHAYILHKNGVYVLADAGSPLGTYLNGQRITQAPLTHGSHIQVGSTVLEFLMRAGAAPVRGPEAFAGAYPAAGPGSIGYAPPQPAPVPTQGYAAMNPAAAPGPMPAQMSPTVAAPGPLQPTVSRGPGFALVAMDGPLVGQRFPIQGPVNLGRESAEIPMAYDSQASRRHTLVTPGPFGVTVADQQSTNGTFVNGQRVTQTEARAGDMLRIGQTTFRIEAS